MGVLQKRNREYSFIFKYIPLIFKLFLFIYVYNNLLFKSFAALLPQNWRWPRPMPTQRPPTTSSQNCGYIERRGRQDRRPKTHPLDVRAWSDQTAC